MKLFVHGRLGLSKLCLSPIYSLSPTEKLARDMYRKDSDWLKGKHKPFKPLRPPAASSAKKTFSKTLGPDGRIPVPRDPGIIASRAHRQIRGLQPRAALESAGPASVGPSFFPPLPLSNASSQTIGVLQSTGYLLSQGHSGLPYGFDPGLTQQDFSLPSDLRQPF